MSKKSSDVVRVKKGKEGEKREPRDEVYFSGKGRPER